MMGPREIPRRENLVEYNYAVAGHAGTLCDVDGELFIKPCTQNEIDFYQSAVDDHPEFADLMPLYMGSLMLNDTSNVGNIPVPAVAEHHAQEIKEKVADMAGQLAPQVPLDNITWKPSGGGKIKTDRAVVLENAAHGYKKPNIMDLKLGQRLWADDAPAQKRAKFEKVRAETTHEKFGFRVAGMRVYKGSHNTAELDTEGYRIYDKDWGSSHVNNDNIVDSIRKFIFNSSAGVDEETGKIVAKAFKTDLERVRQVLENERSRMYSSSLLFVFEGDGHSLRAAMEDVSASGAEAEKSKEKDKNDGRSSSRVDSGIVLDDEGEMIHPEDADDNDDDEEDEPVLPRIYGLKLIDFAHAKFVPHEAEPDENVLKGVRSLIKIFDELSR